MQKLALILTFLLCVGIGWAQKNVTDKEPKVGLVLSGGGAKGMAHIGALKVIEESGITIDFIGGTSMGAIVGALYVEKPILMISFRTTFPGVPRRFMKKKILKDTHLHFLLINLKYRSLQLFLVGKEFTMNSYDYCIM